MNPEPHSTAASEAPDEAPAAAAPVVLETAATLAATLAPILAAPSAAPPDDAPDTVPDQLRELPTDAPLEAAAALPAVPAAPAVPELSPAATGTRLAELFPALFVGPDGKGTWKPIKLRIHADIQARAPGLFTKRTLGVFFSRYTTTTAYLKALANATQRVDLDGQEAGEISDEHRQLAREELTRRQALAAERRAALRPPRREQPAAHDGDAAPASAPEAQPTSRPARAAQPRPRPEPGPERRPEHRPVGRPAQRPPGDAPQPARRDARGPDGAPTQGGRPARPPRHADHAPRAESNARPPRETRREAPPPTQRAQAPITLPADPAQRERAMLLRSFESSPLSKANFCALKGMTPAALDAALAQAQAERGSSR